MTVRTRIAPSPTGIAHLGTAYQAQRDWAYAKNMGGKFIVRIEDTDRERYVEGAVDILFEAFSWLGYINDEGSNVGGPHEPYTQSERLPIYKKHVEELVEKGEAYYCFCTKERLDKLREEQQAQKLVPRYDKHCRNLSTDEVKKRLAAGEKSVIRMKMPLDGDTTFNDLIRGEISFKNTDVDDTVLLKSDGYPTYHLAVVIDDHLMEITHIIRGEEWISSTPKHVQLFKAFGWELPAFAHLSLIRNKDHSKMSKRHNDVSVLSYRDKGYLPEALNNFLALLGWSHPDKKDIFTMEEYVKLFTIERLTTTAPVFDVEKLKWMNGSYIRSLADEDLAARLSAGFVPAACSAELLAKIVPLVKERLVTLKDFDDLASFFYLEPSAVEMSADDKEYLAVAKDLLASCEWSKEGIEGSLIPAVKDHGWKNGPFFAALRLAVTGKKISPPLSESMVILGREKVLLRLKF